MSVTSWTAWFKRPFACRRHDNDWLEEEARKTRVESHEYMTYMTKKTKKRQSAIVTLSDRNQAELNEVRQQRAQMTAEFEKRKDGTL